MGLGLADVARDDRNRRARALEFEAEAHQFGRLEAVADARPPVAPARVTPPTRAAGRLQRR